MKKTPQNLSMRFGSEFIIYAEATELAEKAVNEILWYSVNDQIEVEVSKRVFLLFYRSLENLCETRRIPLEDQLHLLRKITADGDNANTLNVNILNKSTKPNPR